MSAKTENQTTKYTNGKNKSILLLVMCQGSAEMEGFFKFSLMRLILSQYSSQMIDYVSE